MTETTNNILGENMLPLAEIAKPVFNITPRIAQRKAATNTLPVPAFRIGGTRKGPLYVLKLGISQAVHAHSAEACAGEAGEAALRHQLGKPLGHPGAPGRALPT